MNINQVLMQTCDCLVLLKLCTSYFPPKDQVTVNTVSGQSLVSKAANIKVELMILSVSSTGHDIYHRKRWSYCAAVQPWPTVRQPIEFHSCGVLVLAIRRRQITSHESNNNRIPSSISSWRTSLSCKGKKNNKGRTVECWQKDVLWIQKKKRYLRRKIFEE